jgi:hypothetical protein
VARAGQVDPVDDPVRPGPAHGRDERPYPRVAERVVEVGQPVLVPPGQKAVLVERVLGQFRHQAPPADRVGHLLRPFRAGEAGRRHQPYAITRPQAPPAQGIDHRSHSAGGRRSK